MEEQREPSPEISLADHNDRRLKRLQNRELVEGRFERRRHVQEPEIIDTEQAEEEEEVEEIDMKRRYESSEEEDDVEEVNEDDIERRRFIARQKALLKQQEEVNISYTFLSHWLIDKKLNFFLPRKS